MAAENQSAKHEEAEVGIRTDRQPVEQEGKELTHQPRDAGESTGQFLDDGARALRVAKTEGAEAPGHGVC